jgi:uncharacterized protein YqeY
VGGPGNRDVVGGDGMDIQERLMADLKTAMRGGNVEQREAIRMLRSAIKNDEIERGRPLAEPEVQAVISRLVKRHRESIEQFRQANRHDLVAHEEAQLKALEPYLPDLMPRDQIVAVVREVMADVDTSGARAQGQIMSALAPRLRGKADMTVVSSVVRELLGAAG